MVVVVSASLPFEWRTIGNTLITAPLAGMLVYLAARLACPPGLITQAVRLLGNATFAIYLFHLHAVSAALIVVTRVYRDCPLPLAIAFVSGCGIFGGLVVHLLLEKRLIGWTSMAFKAVRRPKVQVGTEDMLSERQPEAA
jgi:peptidoglycan/LPS O-acetylase OafA/YrhL